MLIFSFLMAAMSGFVLALWLVSGKEAQYGPASDPRLARLQRLAAENKDLVEAVSKLVVPVVVALVALAGATLAVVLRQ